MRHENPAIHKVFRNFHNFIWNKIFYPESQKGVFRGCHKYMIREHKEYVLSKQLLRCGTSIGANIAEAQRGQSKADFCSKMSIALKEANETHYWLKLLYRTDFLNKEQYDSLNKDVLELLGILTAICKTTQTGK